MRTRLKQTIRARAERSFLAQIIIGAAAALAAVALRLSLPLGPQQLPTLTVVVTLAIVTAFVGVSAGVSAAVIGGLLSWYLLFNPMSWSLADDAWIPLLGFAVIATTIISTTSLYRATERRWHAQLVSEAERKADDAVLFAREMAHRLKNALAIVQSMSFQTMGGEDPKALAFAARLKTLADANELLSEHISKPVARVEDLVRGALRPFAGLNRLEMQLNDAIMPDSQAINLALALHELATNATKYGAWSAPDGKVNLVIQDIGDALRLTWLESGGPIVTKPGLTGFGSKLLRRAGKNAVLLFRSGGLEYTVDLRKAGTAS